MPSSCKRCAPHVCGSAPPRAATGPGVTRLRRCMTIHAPAFLCGMSKQPTAVGVRTSCTVGADRSLVSPEHDHPSQASARQPVGAGTAQGGRPRQPRRAWFPGPTTPARGVPAGAAPSVPPAAHGQTATSSACALCLPPTRACSPLYTGVGVGARRTPLCETDGSVQRFRLKQQGRRIPAVSFESATSIRRLRVSSFLVARIHRIQS